MIDERPALYKAIYDLTEPECGSCRAPYSCCSPEYCEMAIAWAKDQYGITLPTTDHPKLPLMGPTGCTAAPHYRPLCTLHSCGIYNNGQLRKHPENTAEYFRLRDKVEQLESI